jgi:hypothetical protein
MRPVVSPTDLVECRTRGLLIVLWISGNASITDISSLCRRLAAEVFLEPLLAPDTYSLAPRSWRIRANNEQTTGPILQFICSSPKERILYLLFLCFLIWIFLRSCGKQSTI